MSDIEQILINNLLDYECRLRADNGYIYKKFNETVQYGDYVCYASGGYYEAKKLLKEQIKQLIPKEHRKFIIWVRQLNSLIEENGKVYILSPNVAKKRGWYILSWKTIPRKGNHGRPKDT